MKKGLLVTGLITLALLVGFLSRDLLDRLVRYPPVGGKLPIENVLTANKIVGQVECMQIRQPVVSQPKKGGVKTGTGRIECRLVLGKAGK